MLGFYVETNCNLLKTSSTIRLAQVKCFSFKLHVYKYSDKSPREWGARLMGVLPKARQYIISQGFYIRENLEAW